ncbi:hypothetical protein SAMN05421849_0643 [Pontibaca methylaminivorans]|uniref:Uncharacterized protein n=2 Tax=Pontibaca methylaminivorans TaxID=515897 RepID=A0A1R3WGN9_9RHOB|nr:hypothetical protein SAMN05421849_0643 [Pontibaca methylaminivorans]
MLISRVLEQEVTMPAGNRHRIGNRALGWAAVVVGAVLLAVGGVIVAALLAVAGAAFLIMTGLAMVRPVEDLRPIPVPVRDDPNPRRR